MTLSVIGDRSTSAARPYILQSSDDNAANETLSSTPHCSKRKTADSAQDLMPVGKRLHSQSSLPSAFNAQLTSIKATKNKISMNRRKREKSLYHKRKLTQGSRFLEEPFCQKIVQELTSDKAHLTKPRYNCNLHQTQDLPHLIRVMRPCPPTPLNNNTGTTKTTIRDERILKRLAPDGCNTITRRPQKRRRVTP
jgi:hypothetical protein